MELQIGYEVLASEPVDADRTKVVVETKLNQVINGYGGGKLTFVVENDRIKDAIEERIAGKFIPVAAVAPVASVAAQKLTGMKGNLARIQELVDVAEAKKARIEAEIADFRRKEAEEQAINDLKGDPTPVVEEPVVEQPKPEEPAVIVEQPAPVEEKPADPVVEQPAVVEQPVVEQPKVDLGQEAQPVDLGTPAEPVTSDEIVKGDLGQEAQPIVENGPEPKA